MQPHCNDRRRSAVAIVGRVVDPLIVETQLRKFEHRDRIVRLDDLLGARMRQPAVADENAESARGKVALARGGNAVVDRSQADGVVGRCQRVPCSDSPADTVRSISVNS